MVQLGDWKMEISCAFSCHNPPLRGFYIQQKPISSNYILCDVRRHKMIVNPTPIVIAMWWFNFLIIDITKWCLLLVLLRWLNIDSFWLISLKKVLKSRRIFIRHKLRLLMLKNFYVGCVKKRVFNLLDVVFIWISSSGNVLI